jgi:hypothetical protein
MKVSGQPHAPPALSPVPILYEATLAPEPVQTFWRRGKTLIPIEIRTSDHPARSLRYFTGHTMPDNRNHVRATTVSRPIFICSLHKAAVSTQQDKASSGWNCCYFSDISTTTVLVPAEPTNNVRHGKTGGRKQTCLCSVLSLLVREIRFYNAEWKMSVVSFNKWNSIFSKRMCSYSRVFIPYHQIKTFARTFIFILNKCDVINDSNSFMFQHKYLHVKDISWHKHI